mgnify:CR=1 FL=1
MPYIRSYSSNGSSLRPSRKMFIGCGLSGKNTLPGYAPIQTTAIFPSHIVARSVASFVFRLPVCDADGKKRRIDRSRCRASRSRTETCAVSIHPRRHSIAADSFSILAAGSTGYDGELPQSSATVRSSVSGRCACTRYSRLPLLGGIDRLRKSYFVGRAFYCEKEARYASVFSHGIRRREQGQGRSIFGDIFAAHGHGERFRFAASTPGCGYSYFAIARFVIPRSACHSAAEAAISSSRNCRTCGRCKTTRFAPRRRGAVGRLQSPPVRSLAPAGRILGRLPSEYRTEEPLRTDSVRPYRRLVGRRTPQHRSPVLLQEARRGTFDRSRAAASRD